MSTRQSSAKAKLVARFPRKSNSERARPHRYIVTVVGDLPADLADRVAALHATAIEALDDVVRRRPPDSSPGRQTVRSRPPNASTDDRSNEEEETEG